jgi:hypothetical protein
MIRYLLVAAALSTAPPASAASARAQYASNNGPRIVQVAHLNMQKARSIAFSGHYAWVGENLLGAEVLDVRVPANPRRIQRIAPEKLAPLDLKFVSRDQLITADRFRGLVIWDTRDTDSPTELSVLKLPGIATHVDIAQIGSSRIAAVACAGEGVATVNVTDPARPKLIGQFTTRVDYSRRITLDGNIAYLADHFDGGLKVLDIRETTAPQAFFQVRMRGFCESVSCRGDLLAVGYRNYGVRLFRIARQYDGSSKARDRQTTPSLQYLCNVVRTRSEVRDLQLLPNNLLVVANDIGGLELYDLRNPQLPLLLDEHEFDAPNTAAQSVQEHDGYIYVPSWDGGLYVFKITGTD